MFRFFSAARRFFVWPSVVVLGTVLGGCGSGITSSGSVANPEPSTTPETVALGPSNKAALLLPLSGRFASDGTALLNAAQMALFDMGGADFALVPLDTQGTPEGAAEAARSAVNSQSAIILGPLRAAEVSAAASATQGSNINIVGFSTDPRVAGNGVYLMGFLVYPQIEQMVNYARSQGASRFAILAPNSDYGQSAVSAMEASVARAGGNLVAAEFYDEGTRDFSATVKRIKGRGFDALMLADGGMRLINLSAMLSYHNIEANRRTMILGTMLWNDPRLYSEASLQGAVFPAPSDSQFTNFSQRYASTYKARPPRIATLAYDATALAAVLFKQGSFSDDALTNPSGFAGVDGIFRLHSDGSSERAYSVKRINEGKAVEVMPAPQTFTRPIN